MAEVNLGLLCPCLVTFRPLIRAGYVTDSLVTCVSERDFAFMPRDIFPFKHPISITSKDAPLTTRSYI